MVTISRTAPQLGRGSSFGVVVRPADGGKALQYGDNHIVVSAAIQTAWAVGSGAGADGTRICVILRSGGRFPQISRPDALPGFYLFP